MILIQRVLPFTFFFSLCPVRQHKSNLLFFWLANQHQTYQPTLVSIDLLIVSYLRCSSQSKIVSSRQREFPDPAIEGASPTQCGIPYRPWMALFRTFSERVTKDGDENVEMRQSVECIRIVMISKEAITMTPSIKLKLYQTYYFIFVAHKTESQL